MCRNAIVGHNDVDRTLTRLYSLNQLWKNMKQHVRSYIHNCPCCQKLSAVDAKINAAHFSTSTHAIFDTLNIDYVGPFPDKGYILVIIDAFSRWIEMFWCKDANAESAAESLFTHFGRFGSVTSDDDVEAFWPSGVALSVDEIDDDNTGTSAPFLRDKTCRNVPPNAPDDFVLDSFLGR